MYFVYKMFCAGFVYSTIFGTKYDKPDHMFGFKKIFLSHFAMDPAFSLAVNKR